MPGRTHSVPTALRQLAFRGAAPHPKHLDPTEESLCFCKCVGSTSSKHLIYDNWRTRPSWGTFWPLHQGAKNHNQRQSLKREKTVHLPLQSIGVFPENANRHVPNISIIWLDAVQWSHPTHGFHQRMAQAFLCPQHTEVRWLWHQKGKSPGGKSKLLSRLQEVVFKLCRYSWNF